MMPRAIRFRPGTGFTLIELMAVITIIGILAAVAVPKYADLLRKTNDGATKGSLGSIRGALAIYYSDMEGQFPAQLTGLTFDSKYLTTVPLAKVTNYHPPSSTEEDY